VGEPGPIYLSREPPAFHPVDPIFATSSMEEVVVQVGLQPSSPVAEVATGRPHAVKLWTVAAWEREFAAAVRCVDDVEEK
jgi:hypothetical protein